MPLFLFIFFFNNTNYTHSGPVLPPSGIRAHPSVCQTDTVGEGGSTPRGVKRWETHVPHALTTFWGPFPWGIRVPICIANGFPGAWKPCSAQKTPWVPGGLLCARPQAPNCC